MTVTFRPIALWAHSDHKGARRWHPFRSGWADTLNLLQRELGHLGAQNVVVGCGLREEDIRQDGWPRSGAKQPAHPGVEVSFDSPHGRLVYATDVCAHWEDNVRAIALGLEALRAVDRHGITRRGEQYAGFKALPAGDGPNAERGKQLVDEHGSVRSALHATHPDHGGDARDFADVQAYRELAA
jgi:hypothetical protein